MTGPSRLPETHTYHHPPADPPQNMPTPKHVSPQDTGRGVVSGALSLSCGPYPPLDLRPHGRSRKHRSHTQRLPSPSLSPQGGRGNPPTPMAQLSSLGDRQGGGDSGSHLGVPPGVVGTQAPWPAPPPGPLACSCPPPPQAHGPGHGSRTVLLAGRGLDPTFPEWRQHLLVPGRNVWGPVGGSAWPRSAAAPRVC